MLYTELEEGITKEQSQGFNGSLSDQPTLSSDPQVTKISG